MNEDMFCLVHASCVCPHQLPLYVSVIDKAACPTAVYITTHLPSHELTPAALLPLLPHIQRIVTGARRNRFVPEA